MPDIKHDEQCESGNPEYMTTACRCDERAAIAADDAGRELMLGPESDRESPPPTLAGGVWAILDHDYGESITAVYPTELEALRVINERGYGRVQAIGWGRDVNGDEVVPS